jgi:hypothetical protein
MEFVKGLLAPGTFVKGPEAADGSVLKVLQKGKGSW